ncbi:hypothetical protein [Streptomyces rubradiris]|nr:hypothetical protein [Streptomyces rubradiris]
MTVRLVDADDAVPAELLRAEADLGAGSAVGPSTPEESYGSYAGA